MFALRTLQGKLEEMQTYLNAVLTGTIPKNNQILKKIQDVFNLIPNLSNDELAQAFLTKSNDMHLIIYLSSLVRSVISLHDLVNNKIKYKDIDELEDKEEKAKEESEKAAAAKEKSDDENGKKN